MGFTSGVSSFARPLGRWLLLTDSFLLATLLFGATTFSTIFYMTIFTFRPWVLLTLWLLAGGAHAQRIAAGRTHTASIHADGTLWTWGNNTEGQLGDGTTTSQTAPWQVGRAMNWQRVAAGVAFTVAIRADGTLWAWGNNDHGQLGNGTTTRQTQPVQVGVGSQWQRVSAGEFHTAAIRADGTL